MTHRFGQGAVLLNAEGDGSFPVPPAEGAIVAPASAVAAARTAVPALPDGRFAPRHAATDTGSIGARVRAFLSTLHLSIYQISRITSLPPFGKRTRAFIRDAFYAELSAGQMPDIHQIAALARITGYRLFDWMALFGYDAGLLLPLQLRCHAERTVLLPRVVHDPSRPLAWIRRVAPDAQSPRTQPLEAWIDAVGYAPIGALERLRRGVHMYARIGLRDDMVRSRLSAGSIVRVDTTQTEIGPSRGSRRPLYLVRHPRGLSCCYVERLPTGELVLLPDDASTKIMRWKPGTEARVIGLVDLEMQRLGDGPDPVPPQRRATQIVTQPGAIDRLPEAAGAGAYLRAAREGIGISFREAHAIAREVVRVQGDESYNVALGFLSDSETRATLPRQVSKMLSLCVAYAMDPSEYLRAGGIPPDPPDARPIPPQFLGPLAASLPAGRDEGLAPALSGEGLREITQATGAILDRLGDVPFFLLPALGALLAPHTPVVEDVFVWGDRERALHPCLSGALLVIINRRHKRLTPAAARQMSQRPVLHLVRLPTGQLVAGTCALDGHLLVVQSHSTSGMPALVCEAKAAEVIGRITAVIRRGALP